MNAALLTLTPDMIIVLVLICFIVVMFILNWIRADVVSMLVLVVIGVTGLLPANRLFDGFASNAVLSLIGIMIMGAGLDHTGVLSKTAGLIIHLSKGIDSRVSLLLNAIVGVLSAVIQSQALAALFIPVASRLSSSTGVPLKRLLLPMAFCILAGTSTTLIANSPLILLNDLIASADRNLPPGAATVPTFSLFSVTPIGVPLLLTGLGYFAFVGMRLMTGKGSKRSAAPGRVESYFSDTYGIGGEVRELTVTADSPLVGMRVNEASALEQAPLILALKNGNDAHLAPAGDAMIWVGTVLGVLGTRANVGAFASAMQCRVSIRLRAFADMFNPARAGVAEVVIPPSSKFIKQQVGALGLRKRYGISVLAVNRGEEVTRGEDASKLALRPGDSLVLHSTWHSLLLAAEGHDFVPVTDIPRQELRPRKVRYALTFFSLAMLLGLFTKLHLDIAMITGAVGMLLTGVLSMDEAYDAIRWKTIFMMAGLIPLGAAMGSTGTAAWIAQEIMRYVGHEPQWLIEGYMAVLALVLSQIISHVGTIVMMVPMAINVALAAQGNPTVYVLIVALSVSNTFMLPSASPALLMVMGPGGYQPRDFARVGLPLTVMVLVVTIVMVNVVFNH